MIKRTTVLIIGLFMLGYCMTSCSKTWNCQIDTTSTLGTTTHYVDFKGTRSEMKEYEQSGQDLAQAFGMEQEVNCK